MSRPGESGRSAARALRPAAAGDLDDLAALEARCFGAEPWSRRLIAEELEEPAALVLVAEDPAALVLVAEDPAAFPTGPGSPPGNASHPPRERRPGGTILAYAAFRRIAGEAELLRVAVDPAARRRGTAAALVTAGLDLLRAEGSEACFLEVAAGNAPAVALYRRLGFRAAGRRARYYRSGDDALLMRLDLVSPPGVSPPDCSPPGGPPAGGGVTAG